MDEIVTPEILALKERIKKLDAEAYRLEQQIILLQHIEYWSTH